MQTENEVVEELLERCRADHTAWINGDSSGYEFLDETSTIMGAFGGTGVGESVATPGQRKAVTMFESGAGTVELINSGISGDAAWLVLIERAMVKFKGHDTPCRWDLRVTEVFQRSDSAWTRVHRQADPMVERHPLDEVLALLP